MKLPLVCLSVLFCFTGVSVAQRLDWKSDAFLPLTSLPWSDHGLAVPDVLEKIFKEPDPQVRYPVLAEYFRKHLPGAQLGAAFELCVKLEGTQRPNDLVGLLLPLWAAREAEQALAKTKEWMERVVLEGHPLDLDRWDSRPLRVVNLDEFRASSYWLNASSLGGLGPALADAGRPVELRKQLMRDYANLFIDRAGTLPNSPVTDYPARDLELIQVLELSAEILKTRLLAAGETERKSAAFRAGVARLMALEPASAEEWLELLPIGSHLNQHLLLWSKLDWAGMLQWVEAPRGMNHPARRSAQGILMSGVAKDVRDRWLAEASRVAGDQQPSLAELLEAWARVDPLRALEAAGRYHDADILCEVANETVYPGASSYNRSHPGLAAVRAYDLRRVLPHMSEEAVQSIGWHWGYTEMEQWLEVDAGEAARYGFEYLTRFPDSKVISRGDLIRLLEGDDDAASDSDMIDRTLCALRFWAMWKPDEMRKWIAGLNDPEMQKALTWTLENPWGREAPSQKVNGR